MSKCISLVVILFSLVCFSQKPIHGKVSYLDSDQKNIDVINFTTKKE